MTDNPFSFDPARAQAEVDAFRRKLEAGMETLRHVGPIELGTTPREAVYTEDKLTVWHFRGEKKPTAKTPLLICYALVNTPWMVDLQEDRSMVRNLLDQGEDVYLIDWGYPDGADRWLTLEDYIDGYLDRCVDAVRDRHGDESLNLLGICQGGVFSLCYAALHPEKVRNLVTMVTPVDFHTPDNMLSHWARNVDIDLFVDTMGNIPADLMNFAYLTLKPVRLNQQKYVGLVDVLDNPREVENFLRMEKWIFDSPDQAGEAFREFARDFFQKNLLIKGEAKVGRHRIDLKNITQPVLNIYAEQDHLVPPAASKPLGDAIGSTDYTALAFQGGHIGIYVSGRAQKLVPPAIHEWLADR
ncbi:MAG: class III poly(R)-hydroxyalkanoic acid synthase subunit PhaC [Luteibacter sp.]|uniref:class III poly(R)-hydroxyalkanoic acid synthase subunit PhaC n=1 Tax=Rhodanobacteraceae TaxID=1775411 RepID=UPI000563C011|nr:MULTISPECIES: class III poly(R)-hydroxyalkanoic acid synthase subunit PhaC [Rhodanobacteraceae]MDQ7996639.1 class III poly(R)-hydroxyalkanoic acid synthase subunit PhaC [Luteibacter sp.]MDQ8049634.1 class III poly(R)-hydroxyalkanoic acid synthase subunit PhaC [Luteibacter sp.]MDR6643466.1 polyhydroxyalkanoate synthase [Luteibacter sp. 1214]SDF30972.1 polyhydroxyalkanoate synthase [Dyella sp. 333MFSha]SKB47914.1 polyhydroxyalkanoate synthase [Luteibacter sp. 22Crub2.1]